MDSLEFIKQMHGIDRVMLDTTRRLHAALNVGDDYEIAMQTEAQTVMAQLVANVTGETVADVVQRYNQAASEIEGVL